MKRFIITLFAVSIFLVSCNNNTSTPKPTAYYRMSFPEHKYEVFKPDTCPFMFEYSAYSTVEHSKSDDRLDCWYDVNYNDFNAHIHLTYRKISNNLDSLIDDSHTLVYKHVVKADAINTQDFVNDSLKIYATVYFIEGNAASPLQFHIMDSTKRFVRGSVYFDVTPNSDSLAPAIEFVEEDAKHFVESFEWQNIDCDACN